MSRFNAYDFGALASVGSTLSAVGTIRKPPAAGTVAIQTTDVEVGIDTRSSPVSVTLPSVVAWSNQNRNGLELLILDYFGNGATNHITPTLFAGDTFDYPVTPTVRSNFGYIALRPDPSVPCWYVRGVN